MSGKPDMTAQVKRAILHAGTTRRQLALRAGVSEASVSLFLAGKRGITFDTFLRLAKVLGLELMQVKRAGKGKVKHGKRMQ